MKNRCCKRSANGAEKRRGRSPGGSGAARKGRSPRVGKTVKKLKVRDVVEKGKDKDVKKQMGYEEDKQ